jgi:hypothetical protein
MLPPFGVAFICAIKLPIDKFLERSLPSVLNMEPPQWGVRDFENSIPQAGFGTIL